MHISPLLNSAARHRDANIMMTEGELEPAISGERMLIAPYHTHDQDEELFYVVSGRIGFEVGDDEFIAVAGDGVLVPPGSVHTWWNADPTPARYLMIMPTKLDDLVQAIHERHYSEDEMKDLFARYDSTYIGWKR